jgi:hypothetical protein
MSVCRILVETAALAPIESTASPALARLVSRAQLAKLTSMNVPLSPARTEEPATTRSTATLVLALPA